MPRSLNRCEIIGYVGKDPEMRYTSTGDAITTFSVAVNNSWKGNDGETREETEWFSVVTWRQLAEIVGANLIKGRQVFVEGRMKTRSWDGPDGTKRYRTELVANTVQFLGRSSESGGSRHGDYEDGEVDPEDLPFDNSNDL